MIAPAIPKHIFANLFTKNFYRSDLRNPSFSNSHLEGQNLVHTPTFNIAITNITTYQLSNNKPASNTNDISRYTALTEVQFFIINALRLFE